MSEREAKRWPLGREEDNWGGTGRRRTRGHAATALDLKNIFLTLALGFWPCFRGRSVQICSLHVICPGIKG